MSEPKSACNEILEAVKALGPGPLQASQLRTHVFPLFSRVRSKQDIYLANHSLGRPLDRTAIDVQRGLQLWYEALDEAWEEWLTEIQRFRQHIADLIQAPSEDCIVPKTSAGQGLRVILNAFDDPIPVVTTSAEFNSIDHILNVYAQRRRITLQAINPDAQGTYHEQDLLEAVTTPGSLLVVSMVLFTTGQYFAELSELISKAQAQGAYVLVDLYHVAGVLPVDVQALGADFAIGGCYKYLRGGPGACWLYIHPRHLTGNFRTLDTGWFAQPDPFAFDRTDSGRFSAGGKAFLESTPPILPFYQAKAGLEFTLALGADRLRAYSLTQQARIIDLLQTEGLSVWGTNSHRGAFLALPHQAATKIAQDLKHRHIIVDAREGLLRICPDILTTDDELTTTTRQLSSIIQALT